MMISLVVGLALQPRAIQVADFFPLTKGTTWRYEEKSGKSTIEIVEVAGPPEQIGGVESTPIQARILGQVSDTTYYRVDDNRVLLTAIDPRKPFDPPYPVLQGSANERSTWRFEAITNYTPEPTQHVLQGEAKLLPRTAKVLGNNVEVLEVKLVGKIGPDGPGQILTERVAKYARGIGMFQSKDTTQMGRQKQVRERKLVSFTPPPGEEAR